MNIPSGWEKVKFGDIAKQKSVRVDDPGASGFDRYVGLEHLDSGQLLVKRWGSTQDVKSAMKLFNENDILFARRNTYLRRVSVARFDGVCSGDIIVIEPILDEIVKGFLPIFMQFENFENRIISLSAGAFSKRIKWNQLADEDIIIPSKKEQQRIVDLIWSIQDNIEKTEKLISINEKLKKGLLNELLTKGIGHTKFKQTEIGKIPEEWSIKKLSQVTTAYAGGTPSRSIREFYGGDIPWIKSTEVANGNIYSTEEFITEDALKKSSAKWVPENSTLVAMYGATAGKVCLLKIKATTNQAVLALIPSDELNYSYLYYFAKFIGEDLVNSTQGSGQPNLSKTIITEKLITIPSLPEQETICKKFESTDQIITKLVESANALYNLKKKLTDEILKGEVNI